MPRRVRSYDVSQSLSADKISRLFCIGDDSLGDTEIHLRKMSRLFTFFFQHSMLKLMALTMSSASESFSVVMVFHIL